MSEVNIFQNKTVLVTGAAGTIGSEIARQLSRLGPKTLRLFDNRETALFHVQHEFGDSHMIRTLLGDVRDKNRLMKAMQGVDIVFHAAALKHVPICELEPFEAFRTNVSGTQNVVECAIAANVERVISISTDKAANPMNTMGATKLLAERLVASAFHHKGSARTKFACVRFGNVLGSNGSVVPLFDSQICKNLPMTVTDPGATRFAMSPRQAVGLVFEAARLTNDGEIFVLKMPVLRLAELCDAVADIVTEREGIMRNSVSQKLIGLRPGERKHESLLTKEESERAFETDTMFIVPPEQISGRYPVAGAYPNARKAVVQDYRTDNAPTLSKEQIITFLKNENIIRTTKQ